MLTSSNAQRDRLLCKTADAYFVKGGDWDALVLIVQHLMDLVKASLSNRPPTTRTLAHDSFWNQGEAGAQGTGTRPIADLTLSKASQRRYVGQPLDEGLAKP